MALVADPLAVAPGQDNTSTEIVGARIVDLKIVDGRIVDGRIVGGRVVDAQPAGRRPNRGWHIERHHFHSEVIAVVGFALILLLVYLL